MKAKDIMEPVRDSLSTDTTLKETVNLMQVARRNESKVGVKGMIVLDDKGNLAGIVSIKDILKAIIPSYMSLMELGDFTWDGMLEEMARKVAGKEVKDIMTREVITVDEDIPLMGCADLVVKHNLQRIPVLNKDGKVIGIVYVRDLYYAIVKALLEKDGK
ncbi:inosine 5'-monophosphate dehydrogenase [bacterium BMS3Abin07]|nr:inosine 5'-monophosphate dehydrogenase [bacterium BMS3Abin07]GBE32640.1 inosine 5'-monophosphate dehydrogenase [bacterium BMS3Bbin05]HDL21186.1 CBS domain-containing protein [Nitrospirota bacterium]HDO21541.1 CBS domain-containing protein [Nitrospirota bacterium]